ncbi:MAG TPA: VWA domain-containing protein, partial [Verrucomicrobiae bacterium]
ALLHWHAARARREQLGRLASPQFVTQLTASHSPARRRFKEILLLSAFLLAGLALARPQWGRSTSGHAWVGEDVVFVLDCSQSMTATDVLPSRIQRAKYSVMDFVQRQSHGRVGLVTFAGSAFIQCPLTFDTGAFEESLLAADEKTMPLPGTDIGRALTEAYHAMDKGSHRKMVVLLTDGEDLEKSGIVAAKHLATNGVVVFTIGVGTPSGKEVQTVSAAGQPELLHDEKGQVVRSRLDETTLREIARVTGGSYFPLGALGDGLTKIGPAIQELNSAATRGGKANSVDRFYVPMALALGFIVLETLVGTRRKAGAKAANLDHQTDGNWRLESRQNSQAGKPALLVLALLLAGGNRLIAEVDTNAAVPVTARDFYNTGTKLLADKKFAEAEKMFGLALATKDERVLTASVYNLGHVRFDDGAELLKKGPDAQKVSRQGQAALAAGESALHQGESALAENNLEKMINAYLAGHGARRDLRAAEKAVQAALETYGATLQKWRRAADDFHSAAELNPADTNANYNAQIVENGIAKLVDSVRKMQEMMNGMGKQREQLGKMLSKLKGQMPGQNAPPGAAGDDDDEDGMKPDNLSGKEESGGRQGDEIKVPLSPDQAGQVLDGLGLDGTRRLEMSDKQGKPAAERKGRNW